MKCLTYERPDGGVSIVRPVYQNIREDETEDGFLERIRAKDVPSDASNARIVDVADLPKDRTFRNAWRADLTVDMPKAREIHRDRLRAMRAPLLQALDVEYQKADERGDPTEKQRIAAKKQGLRDATADPTIEAARTPEELKAAVPEVLRP